MKVAESAEVIKNVKISKIETSDRTKVNGSCAYVVNNAEVISLFTQLQCPFL